MWKEDWNNKKDEGYKEITPIEDIIRYLAPKEDKLILKEEDYIQEVIQNSFITKKNISKEEKKDFKEKSKENFIFEESQGPLKIKPIRNDQYQKKIINSVNYNTFVKDYFEDLLKSRQDFTRNIPNKKLIVEPKSILGGVLGWTILGWDTMGKRSDMNYSHMNRYVEVHEGIHTDDEYETRVLSDWMLSYDPHWKSY